MFLLIACNTSLPDVLPSGQCFRRRTAKTMLTSLIIASKWLLHVKATYTICRLTTIGFSVVTDWWVLLRTKPVLVYRNLWSDDRTGMINPFVNLSLSHGKRSPNFCYADFRRCFLLIKKIKIKILVTKKCTTKAIFQFTI